MAEVTFSMELKGAKEAIANLNSLDKKGTRRVVNAGVRAASKPVLATARFMVPVKTGGLKASLRVTSTRLDRATGTVTMTVAVGQQLKRMAKKGQSAFYAHMVSGGTRPHVIRSRRAGALHFGDQFAKTVMHPGSRPNPFMERAAEAAFQAAVGAFAKAFDAKMTEEIAKL